MAMWECECGREPMDYRLLWLRFLRKIWILPIAVLLGMLLVGAVYYYSRTAARGGRTYQAETVFYVDFAENALGEAYDYYNFFTWGEVIHTDFFLDSVYEKMNGELSREELEAYISASVDSDVRYLYVRYNTHSPELSLRLASVMEGILPQFAGMRKEIASIEVVKKGDEAKDSSKIRLANACFLGACLSLGAAVFGILIALTVDTAIYLPATVERRYRVLCLGAPGLPELVPNWQRYIKGASKIAMISVEEGTRSAELVGPEEKVEMIFCKNPVEHPEELERIRTCDRTVLCLRAGRKNHETFMRLLEQLARQEIPVTAALLIPADVGLIMRYYRCKSRTF